MYYAIKTKALIETKKYDECITYCNEAFINIEHFHHDNDIWILSRKSNSLSYLGNLDNAINLHHEIIIKKSHWSLLYELAKMYLSNNDNKNALLYYCRAALTFDPPKMKVGLYFDIAKLLLENSDNENAWKHLVFTKDIREKENWNIPNDLSQLFFELSLKKFECDNIYSDLKYFWRKTVCDVLGECYGIISHLNTGGKTGFIQSGNRSYFFKSSSVMEKSQLKQNQMVTFIPVDSFDLKKNKKTVECAYIMLDKRK